MNKEFYSMCYIINDINKELVTSQYTYSMSSPSKKKHHVSDLILLVFELVL